MKKILLIILLCVILSNTALATLVPIPVQVTVDFKGERNFALLLPNGFERTYSWEVNQSHSDETFTQTVYYDSTNSNFCDGNYQNITTGLMSILGVCSKVVNQSSFCEVNLSASKVQIEEYRRLWEIEQERRQDSENTTAEARSLLSSKTDKLDLCENSLSSCQGTADQYNACQNDLKDADSAKTTYALFAGAAGVAAGYFIWGRKQRTGPSEQYERGSYGDQIRPRDEMPRFDGPRE